MLTRDPHSRATAEELLEHDWLKKYKDKEEVESDQLLEVTTNLKRFQKNTTFQAGVMAVIMQFYERCDDLEQLRQIFVELDKDKNGLLSLDEIHKGLKRVMG